MRNDYSPTNYVMIGVSKNKFQVHQTSSGSTCDSNTTQVETGQSSGEKLPDTEIKLERENTMKRNTTDDVLQAFSSILRYRSALPRKSCGVPVNMSQAWARIGFL